MFMGRRSYLTVKCPKCGINGSLTYRRGVGFCVNHGKTTSHKVDDDVALEVVGGEDIAFFKYPGGDAPLVPYYLKMIPPHITYVEVFGGSAKLLLSKPPSKVEVYNDVDGNLVNLFRVVRDREKFRRFLDELDMILYSRRIYYEMVKRLGEGIQDDVERAVAYYYVLSSSFSGQFGGGFSTSKTMNSAKVFHNRLKALRKVHKRLQNVVIEDLDFRECIKRYDSKQTFFYLDPPHLYITTEKRDDYYSHVFTDSDYMDLLNLLEKIEGKFLLKQAGAIGFVRDWAEKNGFNVRMLTLAKNMEKVVGEKRSKWVVYLIANYKI